ncbi:MAG: 1-acyl-sn-glycerol-3-phosphate acyltransferase [Isosphaeraceae bacterium]|nr:1-acyl-sn-glycerol-3-phosphate acyltransferase [Isosphaeraceae bacterium]
MPPVLKIILAIVLAGFGVIAALPWLVQPLLRALLWTRYRIIVRGLENLPRDGPALIAANHVTWYDGFFLAATCPRRGRALVNGDYVRFPVIRQLTRWVGLIPVPFSGPRAQRAMIQACRDALDRGEVVAIFPEGQLSRNGLTGTFHRGLEVILSGREHVPVVPVFLDNLWGSLLSYSGGRFLKKWPQGWRRTVVVVYGPPVPLPVTAFRVRQAVLEASVRAFEQRPVPVRPLETIDPSLPRLEHPALGPLTGSTADFDQGGVRHLGQRPGSVGRPLPGVALRAVDEQGRPLPEDVVGRLHALAAGHADWRDTGLRGSIDRDGFVRIE